MRKSKIGTKLHVKLRERVEEFLQKHPSAIKKIPPNSVRDLFEDLQVYQIELENSNNELLRVNKKVWEAQERFKQLSEASFEAIAYHKDGVLRKANEQYFNMFGYDPDELIGKNAVPLTVVPESIELMKKQISSGSKETYEAIGLRENGTKFPMEIRVREAAYQGDTIRVAIIRDITEQRQAEEAMRESVEKYRNLVEDSIDGIAIVQGFEMKFVNSALVKMFGYQDEKEMVDHKFTEFVSPEDRQLMKQMGEDREKREHVPGRYQFNALRKDGTKFDAELSASLVRYQGGVARQGVIRDVSKEKQAEKALRESGEKYRGVFDESIAAVYLFDEKKNFLDSNQAGLDLLGYSREELLNMSMLDVDADPIVVLPAHEQLLGGERIINYEHRLNRKDGKVITVLNNSRPITDTNRQVIGMQSTIIDITERKQVLETLRKSEDRLAAFMDSATDGFILFDSELNYVKMNKAAHEITGVDRKDVTGKNVLDVIPDFKETGRYDKYKKVLKTGVPLITPDLIPHPKFGNKRLNLKIFKVGDGLGVIFTDITERKQMEEKLTKSLR